MVGIEIYHLNNITSVQIMLCFIRSKTIFSNPKNTAVGKA